jgi:ribokinase
MTADDLPDLADAACVVVAGLPNAIARAALAAAPPRALRALAPTMRNARDPACPIADLAPHVDFFSCNRGEWDAMGEADRAALRAHARFGVVTDGPAGFTLGRRTPDGWAEHVEPVFPRTRPPRDTNRAGEAVGAWFVVNLVYSGLDRFEVDRRLRAEVARRAAVAAALVLDIPGFGFPTHGDVDVALIRGLAWMP